MTALLDVDNLTIGKPGFSPLVRDVSFSIAPGECFGIVGESGSGKSLTAAAIGGLLPEALAVTSGSIFLDGETIGSKRGRERQLLLRDNLGYVFQNPVTTLNPRLTVKSHIYEALPPAKRNPVDAAELLASVGISHPEALLEAWPHELSGGLAQRVMIATAIARSPRLLVADEPTTSLDVTVQAKVLDLLDEIRKKSGVAVLLISHDIGVIEDRCHRVAVMKGGRLVESGPVRQITTRPTQAYTQQLMDAHPARIALPAPENVRPGPPVLRASGISHSYGKKPVLLPTDLLLRQGQSIGIVGESGSGKTTLARILCGLVAPSMGEIRLNGEAKALDTRKETGRQRLWKDVQYVFQNTFGTFDPRLSVRQVLRLASNGEASTDDINALLATVELDPGLATRRPARLSGGQRQRLAIARALARKPRILVADEPVSALDLTVQAQILRLLARLRAERGMSIILISHDLEVVRRLCDEVLVMTAGAVVERGPSAEILHAPAHDYTRRLLDAVPGRRLAFRPEITPLPERIFPL